MKTAGIRELKTKLSDYIRQAQGGETILITDRGLVVAEMRRPGSEQGALSTADSRFTQAIQRGLVRPSILSAEQKRQFIEHIREGSPGAHLPKGSVSRILDELRQEK
jgi:antitoxin (DNA-binding transcriptional repressor) of toxin-antitoxin stability system